MKISILLVSLTLLAESSFFDTKGNNWSRKFPVGTTANDDKGVSSINGRDLIIASALGLLDTIIRAGVLIVGLKFVESGIGRMLHSILPSQVVQDVNNITRYLKQNSSLTSYEHDIAISAFVNPDMMGGCKDFDDITGLHEAKMAMIQNVEDICDNHSANDKKRSTFSSGLLLYGPPGCGKTALVNGLCKRTRWPMLRVSSSVLLHKYLGESERLIKAVFTLAAKMQPGCILFFDEVDALFRSRSDDDMITHRNLKTEGMLLIDKLAGEKVLLIAATNRPSDLDPALLRRFERAFVVGSPSEEDRLEIFQRSLSNVPLETGFSFRALAKMTKGYTPCDIVNACNVVALRLQRERRSSVAGGKSPPVAVKPVSIKEMIRILKSHRPTSQMINEYGTGFGGSATSAVVGSEEGDSVVRPPSSAASAIFPASSLDSSDSRTTGAADSSENGDYSSEVNPANKWSFWSPLDDDDDEEDEENDGNNVEGNESDP